MSIIVKNLNFSRQVPILKDISFELNEGQSLGIIGPNGGGKSTLLNILTGLLTPQSGEIIIDGILIKKKSDFPREKISYVPQQTEIDSTLPITVTDFISFGLINKNKNDSRSLHDVLQLTGISHKKNSLLAELSGGEKQRVLLGKALISNPKILFLDEPTAGLDSNGEDQLLSLLLEIQKNLKTTLIVVDHNIAQIINFCDKVLCLNKTFHWHQNKELLTTKVLGSIYHCEFEHLVIHQQNINHKGVLTPHIHCEDHHHHDHTHPIENQGKNKS